jgi:hypothetical protein
MEKLRNHIWQIWIGFVIGLIISRSMDYIFKWEITGEKTWLGGLIYVSIILMVVYFTLKASIKKIEWKSK